MIALDDGDRQAPAQGQNGRFQQAGLAGTRRGHQVHHQKSGGVEMRPVMRRLMVIIVQHRVQYVDLPAALRQNTAGDMHIPVADTAADFTQRSVLAAGSAQNRKARRAGAASRRR